jgi:hypothetical protein
MIFALLYNGKIEKEIAKFAQQQRKVALLFVRQSIFASENVRT